MQAGDTVQADAVLAVVAPGAVDVRRTSPRRGPTVGGIRPDLAEVLDRHAVGLDAARPDAVERRRRTGQRTARENVDDLVDPGTFVEYGPLVIAAQRRRRTVEDLIARTPADGLVAGVGTVDGRPDGGAVLRLHGPGRHPGPAEPPQEGPAVRASSSASGCRSCSSPRAAAGGRATPTASGVSGLDCLAFWLLGGLSGLVPMVGITSGRCFAGNAALLGCCDVVIATEGSNIGMGGPAMIEGGGLGVFAPEEIGPLDVQVANGVVDVAVADEAEAVAVAKQYLGYFAGPGRRLDVRRPGRAARRHPREPAPGLRRARGHRTAWPTPARVLELRPGFGLGMVTALARVEGRPLGIVANNPPTSPAPSTPTAPTRPPASSSCATPTTCRCCSCATRPGSWSGPRPSRPALVRHASRLFVVGASLTVPFGTIVLRKGYGLGAQAMAGGSFKAPLFCVAWPTGEFGGMGLEGAVRLGFRKELEAIDDPAERERGLRGDGRPHVRARQGAQRRHRTSRSTTSSTRPTPAAGSRRCWSSAPADPAAGQEAPLHRPLVSDQKLRPGG